MNLLYSTLLAILIGLIIGGLANWTGGEIPDFKPTTWRRRDDP